MPETKRELRNRFAAHALNGLLASKAYQCPIMADHRKAVVKEAFDVADLMILERRRPLPRGSDVADES